LIDFESAFANIDAPFLVAFVGMILTDFFRQPSPAGRR
jgi:hypothetical protein